MAETYYLQEYGQLLLEDGSGALLTEDSNNFLTEGAAAASTDRYLVEDGTLLVIENPVVNAQTGRARIFNTLTNNLTGVTHLQTSLLGDVYLAEFARLLLEDGSGLILLENSDGTLLDGSRTVVTDRFLLESGGFGLLRLEQNDTRDRPQHGVSRLSAVVTKTQSGVARLFNTVTKTQSGVARLQATSDAAVNGIARIQRTVDQPQSGVARLTKTVDQNQIGTARLTKSATQTQSGVARLDVLVTSTQSGVARLQKSVDQTQSGVSNLAPASSGPAISGTTSYGFLWMGEDIAGEVLPEVAVRIAAGDRRFMPQE